MSVLSLEQVRAFVAAHEVALDAYAPMNLFATAAWLKPYLAHCGDPSLEYACEGDGTRGWMLLQRDPTRRGEWRALNNYYAALFSPWAGGSGVNASTAPRDAPGPVLNLTPLASVEADALQSDLRRAGWWTKRYDCFSNWYTPCDGLSFGDYMAARPKEVQNTWRRKARRFERHEGGARLEIVQSPAGVDAAMDAYERVYARSWKQQEPYPGFIRDWAHACARRGWLRLGIAWLAETPIAAHFWFTHDRRANIFKLAYDESYKQLSAGTVLMAALVALSLEQDHVIEIDFLSGNDSYKANWMTHRRMREGLLASDPRHPYGLWRGSRGVLTDWMHRWRQREASMPVVADGS